jgi:hypothetical protein
MTAASVPARPPRPKIDRAAGCNHPVFPTDTVIHVSLTAQRHGTGARYVVRRVAMVILPPSAAPAQSGRQH